MLTRFIAARSREARQFLGPFAKYRRVDVGLLQPKEDPVTRRVVNI
jgi:hypothetical protein